MRQMDENTIKVLEGVPKECIKKSTVECGRSSTRTYIEHIERTVLADASESNHSPGCSSDTLRVPTSSIHPMFLALPLAYRAVCARL